MKQIDGSVPDWTVTPLTTSDWTPVELPDDTSCGSIAVYTSDGSGVYFAKNGAGLDERPWHPENNGEMWSGVCAIAGTKIVLYAKAMAGTPSLILLYQKK